MTTITGTFNNRADAENAIDQLEARGIEPSAISLIVSNTAREKMFKEYVTEDRVASSAEAAGKGSIIGGTLGAIAAGLTTVAAIAVPGAGILAAGPIVAMLAGGGAGAAVGTIAGGLIGAGIPDVEAVEYETALTSGKALVTVHTDDADKVATAKDILKNYNSFYKAA